MQIPESVVRKILTLYGERFVSCDAVMSGYRNHSHIVRCEPDKIANLIVYKSEPGIVERVRRLNALTSVLAASGLPVRYPLNSKLVDVGVGMRRSVAALYNYLPGETIPWEAYRRSHVKLLGMAMARLHAAGEVFEGDLPHVTDECREHVERMRRYFCRDDVIAAMESKLSLRIGIGELERLAEFLEACRELPVRVLHMDLVRSNVLFSTAGADNVLAVDSLAITGILDFEKAALGHPLFDIARSFAFLLVDCPLPYSRLQKYFIDSGYRKYGGGKVRPETVAGKDVLTTLVDLFLLYDLYKFLRNAPYESLPENHHFVRTVAMLRARKLVQ